MGLGEEGEINAGAHYHLMMKVFWLGGTSLPVPLDHELFEGRTRPCSSTYSHGLEKTPGIVWGPFPAGVSGRTNSASEVNDESGTHRLCL